MSRSHHDAHGKRILVVEDGLIMARDIERRLHAMGYGVAGLAQSGEEALRMATHVKPDLVLMDVNLKGGMDGIQAAQKLREIMDVPTVYVTAYSDDATLARAWTTNPFGYVLKPFEEKELRTTIEMAIYRHPLDERLRESEQQYRMLSELTSSYGYSLLVAHDGALTVQWVTEAFERLTGLAAQAVAAHEQYVHPGDLHGLKRRVANLQLGNSEVVEYRIRLRDGGFLWVRDHAHPSPRAHASDPLHVTGSVQDITHSKAAEDLVEQGNLLRSKRDAEIGGHVLNAGRRVLMLLESGLAVSGTKGEQMGELADRLRELVHVQSLVYANVASASASFGKNVKSVVADAFRRAGVGRMAYSLDVEAVEAPQETLVDLLLIVNELILANLGQLRESGRKGTIHVSIRHEANGDLVVGVDDDPALPGKEVDGRKPRSAGLRFVQELVSGLSGKLEIMGKEGTAARIRIPSAHLR